MKILASFGVLFSWEKKDMETSIILGILSLFGSLAGTFGGIMTANRLTGYRIDQLEKKVENLESEVKQSNTPKNVVIAAIVPTICSAYGKFHICARAKYSVPIAGSAIWHTYLRMS